jgi:hypothetical protein
MVAVDVPMLTLVVVEAALICAMFDAASFIAETAVVVADVAAPVSAMMNP